MAVLLAAKMLSLFIKYMLWTEIKFQGIDSLNLLFLVKKWKTKCFYTADPLLSICEVPYIILLKDSVY